MLIENGQRDVRQQWRQDSSLGCTCDRLAVGPHFRQDPSFEKAFTSARASLSPMRCRTFAIQSYMITVDTCRPSSTLTEDRSHEVKWGRTLDLPPDSVWWFLIVVSSTTSGGNLQKTKEFGLFTRLKRGTRYRVLERRSTRWQKNILVDQIVRLTGSRAVQHGLLLRRIGFRDSETNKVLVLLTNDLDSAAITIAKIYRQRWQIELFFKWIKQNLKIKIFLGRSRNAVMTQLWIAMIVYLITRLLEVPIPFQLVAERDTSPAPTQPFRAKKPQTATHRNTTSTS